VRQDLVILRIYTICFPLINDSALVEKVVASLEGDDFLLLVGIEGLSRQIGTVLVVDPRVADHVIRKVDHGAYLLLLGILPNFLLLRDVFHLVARLLYPSHCLWRLAVHHARILHMRLHPLHLHLLAEGELQVASLGHAKVTASALGSLPSEELLVAHWLLLWLLLLSLLIHDLHGLHLLHLLWLLSHEIVLHRLLWLLLGLGLRSAHTLSHVALEGRILLLLLGRHWPGVTREMRAGSALTLVANQSWHRRLDRLLDDWSRSLITHVD